MAIDRGEVVAAALRILDEYGLADLSMRRVADQLGVKAGALYWHVPNKQGLLAAVADEVLAEVPAPSGPTPGALEAWASTLRDVLLRHRDSADLVATALASGLCAADPLDGLEAELAGHLDGRRAAWAAQALVHLVLGHVAHEQNVLLFRQLATEDASPPPLDPAAFTYAVQALVGGLRLAG